jgi:hypothetical protein
MDDRLYGCHNSPTSWSLLKLLAILCIRFGHVSGGCQDLAICMSDVHSQRLTFRIICASNIKCCHGTEKETDRKHSGYPATTLSDQVSVPHIYNNLGEILTPISCAYS